MDKNIKKKSNVFLIYGLFFVPVFLVLFIVAKNSSELINPRRANIILVLLVLAIGSLIFGIRRLIRKEGKKLKKITWALGIFFFLVYYGFSGTFIYMLYGSESKFNDFLITSAMTTLSNQFLATWFYSPEHINEVMSFNAAVEPEGETDADLISIGEEPPKIYWDKHEQEILERDEGQLYKIISIYEKLGSCNILEGKMVVIYDPSKVKLLASKKYDYRNPYLSSGEYINAFYERKGVKIAMNAGAYALDSRKYAFWSLGGHAHGIVVSDGKVLVNNERPLSVGGFMGFDKDNKFMLIKNPTVNKVKAANIRDGVDFGPFLVVNGQALWSKGDGGWGRAGRTAIGQRKDGIVLFLVMNGRRYWDCVPGPNMSELANIMKKYKAFNASALDGGTSSYLYGEGRMINDPRHDGGVKEIRRIPNAFVVME